LGHAGALTVDDPLNRRAIGSSGEDIACDYLVGQGYKILEKNWRLKIGEIDVIALDPAGVTAFVEIKCAQTSRYGTPESHVNRAKQRQIYRMAQAYLQKNKIYKIKCRFDVIGITYKNGRPDIRHLKNAFMG
jgi:putative endonuclease